MVGSVCHRLFLLVLDASSFVQLMTLLDTSAWWGVLVGGVKAGTIDANWDVSPFMCSCSYHTRVINVWRRIVNISFAQLVESLVLNINIQRKILYSSIVKYTRLVLKISFSLIIVDNRRSLLWHQHAIYLNWRGTTVLGGDRCNDGAEVRNGCLLIYA